MQVTKNITLDLLETGSPVIIKAKQNDRNTRYISAHLYVDGLAYPVPNGTEIAFRYKKPDGTAGFYDALPDNSPAITVSGNTVTVELVEQVLTAAGCVHCEINMYNAASEKLTTFTFEISVEESVLTDAEIISSDYYNVLTAEITKALQAVTDATEQAENAAQSAQDAADSAAMSKDWAAGQPVTYSGTPVSIAYAGANRIASITAYGETPQGGTTEAPVALTGISSVTVNDDVTELPIPRPLHKVGDVRDVCRTRVKSVYDKRIVLDGTEYWFISKGVFFYKSAVTDNALTMAACDRYKFHITDNGVSGVTTDKTFAFNIATPERIMIRDDDYTSIEEFKAHLTDNPLTVYYQSTAYDGINGLDICLTEYQNGFVELDGTEYMTLGNIDASQKVQQFDIGNVLSSPKSTDAICSHISSTSSVNGESISIYDNRLLVAVWLREPLLEYGFVEGDSGTYIPAFKAYLAAQKEAGTPVQVAYQLATPETYATDPLDIDNAAGPLTVMTGGKLEVRMTELIGSRSDVSNNTVAFSEAAQDADIASGEKLSVLFGKIKKRFSVVNKLVNGAVYPNLLDNSDFTNPVNQRGSTSYSGGGTYCIDRWDIASTATVAVVSDGIKITATTLSGIRQKIENITDGQLLVFQLCDNADTVYTQAFAASTTQAEYTTDFGKFRFVLNSGGVLTISILLNAGERTFKWAKLEKGSVATPYVPKGYGAELAECLRYFQRVHADWRIYPTLKDMLYRFSQSTLQVMRIKPTISAHGTPYTFGCTINALDAQPMAFTVETKITEQGQNSAAASMLGYFDLSADL